MVGSVTSNSQIPLPRPDHRSIQRTATIWAQAGSERMADRLISTNNRSAAKNIERPKGYRELFKADKSSDTFNTNLSQFLRNTLLMEQTQHKPRPTPLVERAFIQIRHSLISTNSYWGTNETDQNSLIVPVSSFNKYYTRPEEILRFLRFMRILPSLQVPFLLPTYIRLHIRSKIAQGRLP